MANSKQNPQFLGGGPRFNAVGGSAQSPADETAPVAPVKPPGRLLRTIAIAALALLLALLLYTMTNHDTGGTKRDLGRGGVSPTEHQPGASGDRDFGGTP